MSPAASAPTEKLERAGLREKCVRTHLRHQMSDLLQGLMFLALVLGLTCLRG